MGSHKVYEYSKDEMLKIYEEETKNGKTFFGICKQLGINEQTMRALLRSANYEYDRKKKIYVKHRVVEKRKDIKPGYDDAYKNKQLGEVTNKDLLKQIKSIEAEIKNINARIDKGIVRESLNKDIITGGEIEIKSIKQTSIKVDEYTINKFNELCEDYQHINKSYMLSLALKEFIEKYKK